MKVLFKHKIVIKIVTTVFSLMPLAALAEGSNGRLVAQSSASESRTINHADDQKHPYLQEITVTAQKKAQSIQDVPIAISAFSADQIEAANITNHDQLAALTPGLFFGKFSESRPQIYIRGIGSRQFSVGSEGSVGVFIDEVYMGRFSSGLSGLSDIERVEVLKGPQGTLYGRNTIGGAINVITKDPSEETSANAGVGVGNMGYLDWQAAASGPLTDGLIYGRASINFRERNGYVKNLTTGTGHNALDQLSVRTKLLFTPTEDLDVSLTLDYNHANPEGGLQGEFVAGLPVLATGGPHAPKVDTTPSRFDEHYNSDSSFERDIFIANLRVDWNLSEVALTSITAYLDSDMVEARDLDSTSIDSIEHLTDEQAEQFTQELRLSSIPGGAFTFDDRVEWISGLYYLNEKPIRTENLRGGLESVFSQIAASVGSGGPAAPIKLGERHVDNMLIVDVDTTSYAAFGQATIDITERLALTVGARYTRDTKKLHSSGWSSHDGVPPIIAPFDVTLSRRWSSFDPKLILDYKVSEDVMTYYTYSTGFKSGGFQFAKFNAFDASQTFEPENVKTHEIGLKATWFDQRLRTNINYFFYDYTDMQVPKTTTGASGAPAITTLNAAEATVRGFEFDGSLSLSDELTWHAGYAYLDAKYDDYVFNATLDYSGNTMVRSPENTFNSTLEFARPVAEGLLRIRADVSWTDNYYFEPDAGATEGTEQESFALYNLSAAYEFDNWVLSIWGKNLSDEVYKNTTLSFDAFTMEYLGLPRTYGASIRWNY